MSAPVAIVKPGIVGIASYDSKGRWVKWSMTGTEEKDLHGFFLSTGWRWIPKPDTNTGVWYDDEGNPTVVYFDGKKVEYPMERWVPDGGSEQ